MTSLHDEMRREESKPKPPRARTHYRAFDDKPIELSFEEEAFLTGSRVYGTPQVTSDVDLVVNLDENHAEWLADEFPNNVTRLADGKGFTFRFGELNLIVPGSTARLQAWQEGTENCWNARPITRDQAIGIHDRAREANGIDSTSY